MPGKPPPKQFANSMELAAAVQQLTEDERVRLDTKARSLYVGTKYNDPQELLDEAVLRALIGCSGGSRAGEQGRPWPKDVHIVAFLSVCMRGIANDSHHSVEQRVARTTEAIVGEDGEQNDKLHDLELHHPSVDVQLIERQEAEAREATIDADVAAIEAHFAHDQDVTAILEGEKSGTPPAEVRALFEMTETRYETARRRMRRGIDKLMPGRRRK